MTPVFEATGRVVGDCGIQQYARGLALRGMRIPVATHSVPNPAHVRLAEEEDGQAVALQIESSKGLVTIIRFEHAGDGIPRGFKIE